MSISEEAKTSILSQLKIRDAAQYYPYKGVFSQCKKKIICCCRHFFLKSAPHNAIIIFLIITDETLSLKNTQVEAELAKLKTALLSSGGGGGGSGGVASGIDGGDGSGSGVSGGSAAAAAAAGLSVAYSQLESDYKKLKERLDEEHQKTIDGLNKILSQTEALKVKDDEIKELRAKVETQGEDLKKLQTTETSIRDIVTLYNSENKNLRKETESQRDLIRQEQIKNEAVLAQLIRQSEEVEARSVEISALKDKIAQKDGEIARLTEQQKMLASRKSVDSADSIAAASASSPSSSSNSGGGGGGGFFSSFFKPKYQQQQQQQQQHNQDGGKKKKGGVPEYDVTIPTAVDRTLEGHTDDVQSIAYSTSGNLIATGGVDKVVRLWSADVVGQPPVQLKGATKGINRLMFSMEDDLLLGCSNDNSARVWRVMNGSVLHTYTGHSDFVTCGAFVPNTGKILTGSKDRMVKLWDVHKGNCVKSIPCMSSCNDCCVVPGSQTLATAHADKSVRLWDLNVPAMTDTLESIHTGQITSVAASDDGRRLFTLGRDDTIKVVDTYSKNIVATLSDSNFRTASNQARICVSPDFGFVCAGSASGKLFIWDVKMFKLRQVLIPDSAKSDKMYVFLIITFFYLLLYHFLLFIFFLFVCLLACLLVVTLLLLLLGTLKAPRLPRRLRTLS